ncbi:MAG: DUF3015 domain-containing protein [Epsilonproteobacteria bacterium]|nr:DUF3015 domain-containing protein [Campylobacterota bacterium]
MKKSLLLLPLLILVAPAGTIKPKVVGAKDYHRHYDRSVRGGHRNKPIISTIEASAQISSILFIEASSQATTHGGHSRHDPYALNFLDENRIEITRDIAKAEGEHLKTLLKMMALQQDNKALLNIQSNFDTLISLESAEFLTKLKEINS